MSEKKTTIWWETGTRSGTYITPVEVVRETAEKIVLLRWSWNGKNFFEKMVSKGNDYQTYHRSWKEASAFVRSRIETKILDLKLALVKNEQDLELLDGVVEPSEERVRDWMAPVVREGKASPLLYLTS